MYIVTVHILNRRRPLKWRVEHRAQRFVDDLLAKGAQEKSADEKSCTIWPAWRITKITVECIES